MLTHTKVWNTLVQSFPPSMSCTAVLTSPALPGSIAQSVQSPQASVSSIQAPHPGLGAYVFPTHAHHPVRPAPSPLDLVKEPLYHLHVLHHEHPSEQGPWAARVHIPSAPHAQVEGHRAQSSGATQWWGLEEEGGLQGRGPGSLSSGWQSWLKLQVCGVPPLVAGGALSAVRAARWSFQEHVHIP